MNAAGLLILASALLLAAGLREGAEARRHRHGRTRRHRRRAAAVPRWMSVVPALNRGASADRLTRAGVDELLGVRGLVLSRVASASLVALLCLLVAPVVPGRWPRVLVLAGAAGGLVLPDLLLEHRAVRRRRQILSSLAQAIDVLAVGVAGGRSVRSLLAGLAQGSGQLAAELARTVAELEGGSSMTLALAGLRRRVPAAELAKLTLAIERSARLGSPLAAELDRQTRALREAEQRAIAERAARASPKIQLVIALVLVPSVLLLIAAAIAANSDRFFTLL